MLERKRSVLWGLVLVLVVISAGVLVSPSVRPLPPPGPTEVEVSLASEQARAEDLKRQLAEAEAKLGAPRPIPPDPAEEARIADLKRQLAEAEEKLSRPRPDRPDLVARARADDLKARLDRATARLKARPSGEDGSRERAEDLSQQVRDLTEKLMRPRPIIIPPAVATMTKDQIVAARHLLGIYTAQAPFNFAEVHQVQSALRRKFGLVGYFASWQDPFRVDALEEAWRGGYIPLVTWESRSSTGHDGADGANDPEYSLPVILSGRHDEYIRSWARGIRDRQLPVVLRLNHEMNADWYPWSESGSGGRRSVNGNNRGDYVRMWRYVHDIFAAEGANDYVIWLWSPNRVNKIPNQPPPAEFYPGDEYVDWLGMSGYYRYYDATATFDETFGLTLPLLRNASRNKPIFLAEIGATELEGNKVAWINDLFAGLARNPDINGFAWFNHVVTLPVEGELVTNDWRMNSTAATTRAMREQLAASNYGIDLPPTG